MSPSKMALGWGHYLREERGEACPLWLWSWMTPCPAKAKGEKGEQSVVDGSGPLPTLPSKGDPFQNSNLISNSSMVHCNLGWASGIFGTTHVLCKSYCQVKSALQYHSGTAMCTRHQITYVVQVFLRFGHLAPLMHTIGLVGDVPQHPKTTHNNMAPLPAHCHPLMATWTPSSLVQPWGFLSRPARVLSWMV